MTSKLKVLIAGGGTGGHLYPALAIGRLLKEKGARVKYIGSKFGIEANYFKNHNEDAELLNIWGIQRSMSIRGIMKNLQFPWMFCSAYIQSMDVLRNFNPGIVVGTGGYSSGLPLLAATKSNVKSLIQEQNSYPGMTTRKLAGKVDTVCTAYEESADYLKKKTSFSPETLFGEKSN